MSLVDTGTGRDRPGGPRKRVPHNGDRYREPVAAVLRAAEDHRDDAAFGVDHGPTALPRLDPAAQRHDSPVALDLPAEPIELDCDPERLAQVLRILLDNALVHTPAGTGVRVSAARRNGHVRLEVSDLGLGIKRQNMPHIFEPFFTSNEEVQGAGLGLAIARELAERMQGRLTVRSVPGSTTFSLVLPG